ncbi:MAG: AI-2E family transporter [Spongiibacteraceae bacterium]|jgi:predicted PurR-regulated permease PerM|nr:AI-2E family transporter [Spongiibacteraceae bacterium]
MREKLEQRSFLTLLVGVTAAFFWVLSPFFGAIFWAIAATIVFWPFQQWLAQRWGDRRTLNALLTLLLFTVVVVVPLMLLGAVLLDEALSLYQRIESGELSMATYIDRARSAVPWVSELLVRFDIDIERMRSSLAEGALNATRTVATHTLTIGQNVLQLVVSTALMLYLTFFLLRDGDWLVQLLIRVLPLGDARERALFAKFAEVTRATIKGNLVVAIIQGALGGLIFWALGIGGAVLWGVVMAFMSMLPAVGTAVVWVPVAIWLLATGSWIQGLVLIGFGAGVIGLVDNLLRPLLVGRDTKMPDYLVLFSTLGGLAIFGLSGFVIGPLIAALFLAFWGIFSREFNHEGPA